MYPTLFPSSISTKTWLQFSTEVKASVINGEVGEGRPSAFSGFVYLARPVPRHIGAAPYLSEAPSSLEEREQPPSRKK